MKKTSLLACSWALLAYLLVFSISCYSTLEKIEESTPTLSKYILRLIVNTNQIPDDKFKDYVMEIIYSEKWLEMYGNPVKVRFKTVERLHTGEYIYSAWIYYERLKKDG